MNAPVHGAAMRRDVASARRTNAVSAGDAMSISTPEPNITVSNDVPENGCVSTRMPADDSTSPPSSDSTDT